MSNKKPVIKRRNHIARNDLMRKGGAHVKSKKSIRSQEKVQLKSDIKNKNI